MKQPSYTDFKRLEQKIDLVGDKLDRIMEAQGIKQIGEIAPAQPDAPKRKARERKQQHLIEKEAFQEQVLQGMKDSAMRMGAGKILQQQFNLLQPPSADRIREYQRTQDPKAFDGLRRMAPGAKK
jgi:hypothetical protein